jgi:hypothetical protein
MSSDRIRVLLWDYHVESALVAELAREGFEIVATVDGGVSGVLHIPLESFALPGLMGEVRLWNEGSFIPSDHDFRSYSRCISRVGVNPFSSRVFLELVGAFFPEDVESWMRIHVRQCMEWLKRLSVQEVWFTSVPHFGLDQAMKVAAQYLDIPVLVTRQLPFPAKFTFSVSYRDRRMESFLSDFRPWNSGAMLPNLFYMRKADSATWRYALERFLDVVVSTVRARSLLELPSRLLEAAFRRRWFGLIAALSFVLPGKFGFGAGVWRRYVNWRRFRRKRRMCPVTCLEPYIYFALHCEPEANADLYGGEYACQPDALAALSEALPEGWRILVKENPAQGFVRRGEAFYRLIEALPNVFWVPDETSSAMLVERAALVASLCGTVGYESLLAGKPCLYFGDPWYAGLPGAVRFRAGIDLAALAKARVDKSELDAAVNALVSAAADGIATRRFTALVPDQGESEAMTRLTARSLASISRAARAVFG